MERLTSEIASPVAEFLARGIVDGQEPAALAKAVDDLIRRETQRSLKKTIPIARRFVRQAARHEGVLLLTAYRSLARVTHMSARHQEAEGAYLRARSLAGRDDMTKGRIDRALIDVYMYLGDFAESRRRARLALAAFKRQHAVGDIAMTRVNFANLLHRQDRHKEAERMYHLAAQYFESVGDELSWARCLYNRANTLVQLFDFEQASQLYAESQKIYLKHDHDLDATDARYGRAWLSMLLGRFHIALLELSACEAAYKASGQPKGAALCELDRAEVYLGLGLLSDAREAARSAASQFNSMGHQYELAKARFFQAKAAFGLNLKSEARAALKKASGTFERDHNLGFLGAVHLLSAQLAASPAAQAKELHQARALFSGAQLPLWAGVCDLHHAGNPRTANKALIRLQKNPAVQTVPHLFSWWQTVLGDRQDRRGNISAARQHWQMAADRLDAVRAQLPPLDLRSKFSAIAETPHAKLIESQLVDDAQAAAAWSERFKTAGLWAPTSSLSVSNEERSRAEQSLILLAAQVASMSRHIGGLSGERASMTAEAHSGISRLQRQIRLEMAAMEKHATGTVDSVQKLRTAFAVTSAARPIVQFHLSRNDLIAFVHEHGATRLVRYPNGRAEINAAMRQWRFLLESELLSRHLSVRSQVHAEQRFFRQLGETIWAPLDISSGTKSVLLIPEGDLANLPWQAIELSDGPLYLRHGCVQTPSLRHYLYASSLEVTSREVHIFQGAADDLPMAKAELLHLSQQSGPNTICHFPSARADWPHDGESRLWHYAGHASHRADNPFYSSLTLADGPLFAADFRLRRARVGLVTLAACRSGQQVSMPGEESTGLVRSLLEMGARNVIAGHWPVSDDSTALWMNSFYDKYFAGSAILESMQHAASQVRTRFPSAYHWAAFAVYGAGE